MQDMQGTWKSSNGGRFEIEGDKVITTKEGKRQQIGSIKPLHLKEQGVISVEYTSYGGRSIAANTKKSDGATIVWMAKKGEPDPPVWMKM